MKVKKVVPILLLALLCLSFIISSASAAQVEGYLNAVPPIIYTGNKVTLTCTYVYIPDAGETKLGIGSLEITGPHPNQLTEFEVGISWTVIAIWKSSNPLTSGVPVSFEKQLNDPGYYYFRWNCQTIDGQLAGAFVIVEVLVIDEPPPPVPEGSSIAVLAMSLAAVGAFAIIAKRRNPVKKVE